MSGMETYKINSNGCQSQNKEKIGIGDYSTTDSTILRCSGLGSCIAVGLYDPNNDLYGLGHFMLPGDDLSENENSMKYIEPGLSSIINELKELGAEEKNIEAKIAGAASILDFSEERDDIAQKNLEKARTYLEKEEITITGEDVGGDTGKTVKFGSADSLGYEAESDYLMVVEATSKHSNSRLI